MDQLGVRFCTYFTAKMTTIDETTTVDTDNYFVVAQIDDQANASGSGTPAADEPVDDKASRKARRDQRIADAVTRSRVEYTADNVYTERGVGPILSSLGVWLQN
jgi:hypothetical protein